MKISWGVKIFILYAGFVGLITTLVIASSRQHFDLVSASYYADEIAYQKVIDADKNSAALSSSISIHANEHDVMLDFPAELKDKEFTGTVYFYSPVNAAWDKRFAIKGNDNTMHISRSELRNMLYTVKVSVNVNGRSYYQESQINLHS